MGFKARESIKLLQPVLDLAAGSLGQLGLADAASAVAGTMRAFRLETGKATEVTDKLLRITQLTNFQAKDFGSGLSKAAGEAGQFGQTINDTLILMGLLRNMNLNASVSSTAVRNAIRRLAGDARVRNLVESKGVQVYDKLTGKMRPVLDILADLDSKTKNLARSEKDLLSAKIFGARGIFAAGAFEGARFTKVLANGNQVVLKGMDAIRAYRAELEKSAGTAKRFREALLGTFEGQKKLLTGIIQTAGVLAGEPFVAVLKPFVRLVVQLSNTLLKAFQKIPAPVKKFLAALVVAFSTFAAFATAVIAAKLAIAGIGIAFAALNITFIGLLGTVAILAAAFTGLIAIGAAIFAAFKTNFGGITDAFMRVKAAVIGVFAVMKAWKDGTSTLSKEMAKDLEKAGVLDFTIRLGGFLGRVKQAFIDLWNFAKFVAEPLADSLRPLGIALKNLIVVLFQAGKRIFEALFGPIEAMKGTRKDISSFFVVIKKGLDLIAKAARFAAKVINFIATVIKTVIQPGFFTVVFNKVASILKKIWAFLRPIVAILVNAAIKLLPAISVLFGAIWEIIKSIGLAIGAIAVGLFKGLDAMTGDGFLSVIQAIANVFVFIARS